MRKKTGFIAGMVTMLLIVSLIGSAAAVNATVSKNLTYKNIKIMLNGKELTPKDAKGNVVEPFVIDGTTYLPVRAIGEALGLDVGWDGSTNTAILTAKNAVQKGTILYEDEYVAISFDSIVESEYAWMDYASDAVFAVKNKTDYPLTIQASAISFDGISYEVSCSEEVAPKSIGKVRCNSQEEIPQNITVCTGKVTVIDWETDSGPIPGYKYEAIWAEKGV